MTKPMVRPPPREGPGGFGARLRILRKRHGLYQQDLAEKLHCEKSAIGKWETGRSYPTFWFLIEITKFFDADIAWLTGMEFGTNHGGTHDGHQQDAGRTR